MLWICQRTRGLGIDQVVPLPIVAGGPQLHQHHETDQGLPGDALQGVAGRGSQPLSAAAADVEMPLSLYVLGAIKLVLTIIFSA